MTDQRDEKIEQLSSDLRASRDRVSKAESSNKLLADNVSRLAQRCHQLERELEVARKAKRR